MNDPKSSDILKKTFEYLEEVLEEDSNHNKKGTAERRAGTENTSTGRKNTSSTTVHDDCCSA